MKLKLSKQGTYADIARSNKDIFCVDLKSHLRFLTDGKAKASTSTPGSSKAASVPFQGKVCHNKTPVFRERMLSSRNKYARGYCVTVVLLSFKYFSQFQIREYLSDITGTKY